MSAPIPLSREDRDILALESATVAGHTCKVAVFEGEAPSLGELRDSVEARLPDMLRRRLGGTEEEPAWVEDESFSIDRHVVRGPRSRRACGMRGGAVRRSAWTARCRCGGSTWSGWRAAARRWCGASTTPWPTARPACSIARQMLWDESPDPPRAGVAAADHERRRGHLAGFVRREFVEGGGRSPFDGRIGARRKVAFALVPLRELHDAAKRLAGATLNDAVLSVTAGAVRRWAEAHHGRLGTLRVRVPVSLHHQGEDAGNRDSYFCVALPLDEPDPVARLRRGPPRVPAAQVRARRRGDGPPAARACPGVSPSLERMCEQFEGSPRQFALSVSNVRGPAQPVSVLGSPVDRVHFVAEIGERHALRVSVNSFVDRLSFGFCADPEIVDGVESMAAGVEEEARALIDST